MGLVFLVIKIFPFFGISFGVIFLDLSRSMKRKGGKSWIGLLFVSAMMFLTTAAWVFFRGDRNADLWFARLMDWLQFK
jgi:hypothetical protein